MKKFRKLMLFLALVSVLSIGCSNDVEEQFQPDITEISTEYCNFMDSWDKAAWSADKMPKEPKYTSMTAEQADAFVRAAEIDGHYATASSKSVTVEYEEGMYIRQSDKGNWYIDDYTFDTFLSDFQSGSLSVFPRYFYMPSHNLISFSGKCTAQGWTVVSTEKNDFRIKFSDKLEGVQTFDGWQFTDTTFSEGFEAFTGENIEVLPTELLFNTMNEIQLSTFNSITGYSGMVREDGAFYIVLSDVIEDKYQVEKSLIQNPVDGTWKIEVNRIFVGDAAPTTKAPATDQVKVTDVVMKDPISIYMIGCKGYAKFIAIRNNGSSTVDLSDYCIGSNLNISDASKNHTIKKGAKFGNISIEKGGVLFLLKPRGSNDVITMYRNNLGLVFDDSVKASSTFKNAWMVYKNVTDFTGNDEIYLMKGDVVIDSVNSEYPCDDRGDLKQVGDGFMKGETEYTAYDSQDNVIGCPLKENVYIRNFKFEPTSVTATSWNAYKYDNPVMREWVNKFKPAKI